MNVWVVDTLLAVSLILSCGAHGGVLDATFHKLTASDNRQVSFSYKTKAGTTISLFRCAAMCLGDTGSPPYCGSFTFSPEEKSCDFYSVGTEHSVPLNLDLYRLRVNDVFHLISVEGRLYSIYLSSVNKTYEEARSHCVSLGGYLLHFDSLDEYQAVKMIGARSDTGNSFVGANDIEEEGTWVSEKDGAELDTSVWTWHPVEPNNIDGQENCAVIEYKDHLLNDIPCHWLRTFLCERDV